MNKEQEIRQWLHSRFLATSAFTEESIRISVASHLPLIKAEDVKVHRSIKNLNQNDADITILNLRKLFYQSQEEANYAFYESYEKFLDSFCSFKGLNFLNEKGIYTNFTIKKEIVLQILDYIVTLKNKTF